MPSKTYFQRTTAHLANEAGAACLAFANGEGLQIDDNGWTVIPYGLWPHVKGLQNFGKDQAEAIFNSWKSIMGQLKRAVVGYPVYKGHPDVPGLEDEFPDKTAYGQVADMEVRDNGLAIKPVLSNAGAELVRQGFKFISPFWEATPSGTANGTILWSPFRINSIGLVKRPNIPNKSLDNNSTMNKTLIALLKLAADSTDEQVVAAVTALANAQTEQATAMANAKTEAATKLENANKAKADAEKASADAATALANERTARITDIIDDAVKTGRIPAADRDTWKKRLETNFGPEQGALANIAPTVKTTATAEQMALSTLNSRLASMTPEERTAFAKTGALPNADDGDQGNDMDNVKKLSNLVANEMESPACKKIASACKRHQVAFNNVLKAHPEFTKLGGADDEEQN